MTTLGDIPDEILSEILSYRSNPVNKRVAHNWKQEEESDHLNNTRTNYMLRNYKFINYVPSSYVIKAWKRGDTDVIKWISRQVELSPMNYVDDTQLMRYLSSITGKDTVLAFDNHVEFAKSRSKITLQDALNAEAWKIAEVLVKSGATLDIYGIKNRTRFFSNVPLNLATMLYNLATGSNKVSEFNAVFGNFAINPSVHHLSIVIARGNEKHLKEYARISNKSKSVIYEVVDNGTVAVYNMFSGVEGRENLIINLSYPRNDVKFPASRETDVVKYALQREDLKTVEWVDRHYSKHIRWQSIGFLNFPTESIKYLMSKRKYNATWISNYAIQVRDLELLEHIVKQGAISWESIASLNIYNDHVVAKFVTDMRKRG